MSEHATVEVLQGFLDAFNRWKTLLVVEQHFRKLNAPHLCTAVYDGVVFHDGIRAATPARARRAA